MPFFGSKGQECWICGRNTLEEGQFLDNESLQEVFKEVFKEFDSEDLKNHCLCQVCAGILKFTAQDSVAAKIAIGEASDKVKDKLSSAKSAFASRFGGDDE